ncbi:hypothetical protein C8J57DRAFT_1526601 [Mycena rebaudengoi]|nr:hypothetical protein C8J57DRAFT_1526601 [Mycena rebaudengoi]
MAMCAQATTRRALALQLGAHILRASKHTRVLQYGAVRSSARPYRPLHAIGLLPRTHPFIAVLYPSFYPLPPPAHAGSWRHHGEAPDADRHPSPHPTDLRSSPPTCMSIQIPSPPSPILSLAVPHVLLNLPPIWLLPPSHPSPPFITFPLSVPSLCFVSI